MVVIIDAPSCPYNSSWRKGCICNACKSKYRRRRYKSYRKSKSNTFNRWLASVKEYKLSPESSSRNFQDLCPKHRQYLLTQARRYTGQDHTAEDLVQEAFVKAFLFWDQFAQESQDINQDVKRWLGRILSNTFYTQYQRDQRRSQAMDNYRENLDIDESSPEEYTDAVQAAIAKLKPIYREVVELHYTQGQTYNDIAQILNIPFTKAQKRLWRARQLIKESLLQAGFVDSSAFEAPQGVQAEAAGIDTIVGGDDSLTFDDTEATPDSLSSW